MQWVYQLIIRLTLTAIPPNEKSPKVGMNAQRNK